MEKRGTATQIRFDCARGRILWLDAALTRRKVDVRVRTIRHQSERARRILYPAVAFAVVNFAALLAGSAYFGGNALNGYMRLGRYFLCLRAHTACIQVSATVWHYSYCQTLLTIALFALVIGATALFIRTGDIEVE